MIAQELEVSLHMAFVEARQQRHEFITVEHLLMALLDNPSAAEVLRSGSSGKLPLISPPAGEYLAREFQAELHRRDLRWPARIEASGLELIDVYVAEGFGAGLSLEIPGFRRRPEVRGLPLRGFPKLSFCALWSGRLPALAAQFLELARSRARELRAESRGA